MTIFLLVLLLIVLLLLALGYAAFYLGCVRLPIKPDPEKSKPYRMFILRMSPKENSINKQEIRCVCL